MFMLRLCGMGGGGVGGPGGNIFNIGRSKAILFEAKKTRGFKD
jgi:hypothetical protein